MPETLRMKRSECSGLAFSAIARNVQRANGGWKETCRPLGGGILYTACVPDLKDYLGDRGLLNRKRRGSR